MPIKRLREHLLSRPAELKKLQSRGCKVVGYLPGEYVPEEIIHAAGAAGVCLSHGGDPESVEAAHSAITRFVCPFSKAQIGYRFIGEQPYYEVFGLLIAPITCQHLRRVADMYNYYTDVDVFRIGIPHQYNTHHGLAYYKESLMMLRKKLEEYTGNVISETGLKDSIKLYNRMRDLFRNISMLRSGVNYPLSSLEFVRLIHGSLHADPVFMVEVLEKFYEEIKGISPPERHGPRIMLIGPNLAQGDYKVLQLIEEAGGHVVIEHMDECLRFYWENVEVDGDPWENIARRYLQHKLPSVYMVKAYRDRLRFIIDKSKEYNVDGIILHKLKYCETADTESYYLEEQIKQNGFPFLRLESEYDVSDRGPLKTRIEAFIEGLRRR